MTKKIEEKLRNTQVQVLLNRAVAADMEIYNSLIGQRVVLEESEVGIGISIATLKNHGAELADFENYIKYDAPLPIIFSPCKTSTKFNPEYKIPNRKINKSQIASIQSLENVLQGRKFEDIFEVSEEN
jgi:hypothetical protein